MASLTNLVDETGGGDGVGVKLGGEVFDVLTEGVEEEQVGRDGEAYCGDESADGLEDFHENHRLIFLLEKGLHIRVSSDETENGGIASHLSINSIARSALNVNGQNGYFYGQNGGKPVENLWKTCGKPVENLWKTILL